MPRLKQVLPGFTLSFAVALAATGLAVWLPQLGGATLAILLGIVLGNTLCRHPRLGAGTKLAESRLLEYSVVLLGLTVTFQTIAHMGWRGLVYVLLMMTTVICGAYLIGRRLGFGETMSLMFAGGNAVCGSSAIGAIAPAIGADDREKGETITLVNLLGTVMMLTLPFLGQAVFGRHILATSAMLGGTLQSVGQVVAGASLLSPQVVSYAMLFKITRIIMLVVVVTLFTQKVRRSQAAATAAAVGATPAATTTVATATEAADDGATTVAATAEAAAAIQAAAMTETAVVTPATPVADASVATVGDGPVADASVATVGDEPVAAASVATVGDEPAAAGAANAHVAGATAATRPAPAKAKRRLPVPWYVLGFLILCVLNSAVTLPPVWASGAHFVSTWFETTALAAIGLRLNFGNFMRQGRRFLAYGLSVGALQTVAALALLKLLAV